MQAAGLSKIEEICSHSQAGRCLPNGVPALVEGNNHADDSEFEKSAVPCALLHPMHRQVSSCLLKNMVTYPPLNSYISETASSPVCTGDTQPQHPAGMQWQELASSRPRSMLFKMLSGFRGQSNHKVSKSPGPHHTAPHCTTPHHTTAARQLRGCGARPQAESSGAWGGSTPAKPPGNQTPVPPAVPRDPEPPAHPGTMEGSPMAKPGTSA